jgi:hypothetical protein
MSLSSDIFFDAILLLLLHKIKYWPKNIQDVLSGM